MNDTTKPCPFCGQLPDVNNLDFCYLLFSEATLEIWRAGCIASAGGCGAEVTGQSAEEAIERWERRV